jgi:FMN reductase
LFDWSSSDVQAAVDSVAGCRLLVVASPTYKASFTGLLKAFLDRFGTTGLSGVTTVPVMVGAGPTHALAVEVHLRPVLVEIGATVPTRGLYVVESDLLRLVEVVDEWARDAGPALRRAVAP